MNEGRHLSGGAWGFLIVVGATADATKIGLDLAFGIGAVLDPFVISPVAGMLFWITLSHNGIPMFSGKQAAAGWSNLIVAEIPVVDALPDWTIYAIYLGLANR